MQKTLLLSLITINFLYAEMTIDEKRKILEEKLFGTTSTKKASAKSFYLPLKVNDILQDEIFVKIDNQENILVTKNTFTYVASLLKEEFKAKYKIKVDKDLYAPLSALEQQGIKALYDSKNIMLNIFIPAHIKKASLIRLRGRFNRDINGSTLPKTFSGGANFYLNQQYHKNNSNSFEKGALNASSDLHLNLNDFVLEGRLNYNDSDKKVKRGRFRVVKDDPKNQLRYKAGDIYLPSGDRIAYIEALGVAVEKLYTVGGDYSQNIRRINSHEFFIQNESRVEIYVNNRYRNSLELKAGTHNLYDLNLPQGVNRVKLKVIEKGGKIEIVEFNDFSYSEILRKGLVWYGAGLGVESRYLGNELEYEEKRKVASAYVEYGLLDNMTVESAVQVGEDYTAGSLEVLLGTNLGFINPYVVTSKKNGEIGNKHGMEFQTNIGQVFVNLGYEDIDKEYAHLYDYTNEETTLYRGNLYTQLGMGIGLSLSASKYERDSNDENRYNVRLQKSFRNWSTELNWDRTESDNGQRDEDRIYATLEYRFGQNSARYTNYINEGEHQFNLRHNNTGRYGLSSEFQYDNREDAQNYYLMSELENEKFRLNVNYRVNDYNSNKNEAVDVQLATGFVFAGTKATITAPINSGFVIVDNDDKIEESLGVVGYHEEGEYIYDKYAIDVSDYTQRELTVDESALDFGTDLENSNEKFITNYRSGSVMDIVVKNIYSIKGVFFDKATQKPLKFKAFKVFNTQTGERSNSFTTENGEFTINQADIGHYNITFMRERNTEASARYSFEINEENKEHLKDLGNIYIETPIKIEPKKYFIYGEGNTTSPK